MLENDRQKNRYHRLFAVGSWLVAFMAVLVALQTIRAESPELLPPDLSSSYKEADSSVAVPATTVGYTVVISNSGTTPDLDVVMTDTLPGELAYESGSIAVTGGGIYTVTGNVIVWSGAVNNGSEVTIEFSAVLTSTAAAGTVITNTAEISGTSTVIERSDAITVVEDLGIYLPHIASPILPPSSPTLNAIGRPTSNNSWSMSWSISNPSNVTGYEIQESNTATFSNVITTYNTTNTSLTVTKPFTTNNIYYYRVRGLAGPVIGSWSNVQQIIVGYRDDFDAATTWDIRREDTDDTDNSLYYTISGLLVHRQFGRWDYMISSPLAPAVTPPYRFETRIQFTGVDNLHAYGMIFGGDWNGNTCPDQNYTSCFNQYYRLLVLWYGSPNQLRFGLKRIDYHDPSSNTGSGETLLSFRDVDVSPPPSSWQTWAVEVNPNGLIQIFVNGNLVGQKIDTTLINNPYFGGFSATNEYAGLRVDYDWVQITPLP